MAVSLSLVCGAAATARVVWAGDHPASPVTDTQTTVATLTVPGSGYDALAFSAVFLDPDGTLTVVACGLDVAPTGAATLLASPTMQTY